MKTEEEIKKLIANIKSAIECLNDNTCISGDDGCFPARQIWFEQMYNQISILKWVLE